MIKTFSNKIPRFLQILIIVVLAVYYLVAHGNLRWSVDFLNYFRNLLPILLLFVAVLIMAFRNQLFAAHAVLLIVWYMSKGMDEIKRLFAFNYASLTFGEVFISVIYIIIFIYLLLMIFSYLFSNKQVGGKSQKGQTVALAILTFICFYLGSSYGLYPSGSYYHMAAIFVAIAFGSPIAALLLILSILIDIPFALILHIVENTLMDQTLGYFILSIFGIYLIYLSIKYLIKEK